jgi:hypothetical protein
MHVYATQAWELLEVEDAATSPSSKDADDPVEVVVVWYSVQKQAPPPPPPGSLRNNPVESWKLMGLFPE